MEKNLINDFKKSGHDKHDGWTVGLIRGEINSDNDAFDMLVCEGKRKYTRFEAAAKEARKVDRQLKQAGIEDVYSIVLEVIDDDIVLSAAHH